jgi:hypothetical protein
MTISTKLLALLLLIFCYTPSLQAQQETRQAITPPDRVAVKFNAKYPKQINNASWQQTDKGYSASFTHEGRQTVSRFSNEGRWQGSDIQLKQGQLPAPAQQYLKENHEGARYLKGMHYQTSDGSRYQLDVERDGKRYRLDFDHNGNFVNESPLGE